MPNLKKLERAVDHYRRELINTHKKIRCTRFYDGKLKEIWDLPCVAVCCSYDTGIFHGFSARVKANSYDKAPALKALL